MDKKTHDIIKEMALPAGEWKSEPLAGEILIAHKDYVIHRELPLHYVFSDPASFSAYCKTDIFPEVGIIFYSNNGLVGLHHRMAPCGNRISYSFNLSPELLAWESANRLSHGNFRKFLEERLDELTDPEIFKALATLKFNTVINFQSDFDDDRNYGFIYEEKEGRGSSKIPKEFVVKVPFFANDPPREIPLRLTIRPPKDSESKPLFNIEIIRQEKLLSENVNELIKKLRMQLPDYSILHGRF